MQATDPPLVSPPSVWSSVRSVKQVDGLSKEEQVALRVSGGFIPAATRVSNPLRHVEVVTFSQGKIPGRDEDVEGPESSRREKSLL